ncbi:uncharacterized protein LOC122788017 [Protopterus annectens]|uniref:uncharacterized protein LOC122788017 n=1 Tax=Protopterus annectens TaxID=7888 RepID=UPI001CFA9ABF|nr:uncharacterized protein LOC122788017 [Protopterus annectens]
MASIFKQVVGHITGNSDRDLIRVNSQFNSEKFKPLCLIRRQQKHFFFRKFRYIGTGFVLEDVLEGSQKTNIDVDVVGDVCFFEISKRELGGKLSIPVEVGKVDFKSSASQANVINMKLKKMTVNMQQLEDCIQTIKFNLKHGLMKGLMKVRNEHLCVVTEAIITDEELELEQIRTLDGNLKITIFNNPEALEGKKASYQRLRVSSGTVLAYGVHPLQISRYVGTGALLYVENKKVKSSFHTDDIMKTLQTRMSYEMISKCSGGFDSTAMRLQKGSSNSISFTEDTWVLPNEENLFKGN